MRIEGRGIYKAELISDIIEPLAKIDNCSTEAQSTEEVLRNIQDTNQWLQRDKVKNVAIGSLNVDCRGTLHIDQSKHFENFILTVNILLEHFA